MSSFTEGGYLDHIDIVVEFHLLIHEHYLLKDNKKRDNRDLCLIQQAVNDIIFPQMSNSYSWKVAWDIHETDCQGITKVNIIKLRNLRGDLKLLRMKESNSIEKFMTWAMNVVNQLRQYGRIP